MFRDSHVASHNSLPTEHSWDTTSNAGSQAASDSETGRGGQEGGTEFGGTVPDDDGLPKFFHL